MSFLFGTKNLPTPDNKRLGLNDTSTASNEQGSPLPYLAGTRRFAGTFITDAFDQQAISQGSGGKDAGKGGGGRGTNYYASFAIAFCVGPCDVFSDLFLNGDAVYTESTPLYPIELSQANNIATFQAANAHGLSSGQSVVITGADQPEFNGEFIITVTGDTTFTYQIPGSSVLAEVATGQIQCWIKLDPIYRQAGEDSVDVTIPNYGVITIHWGTETQPADSYLQVSGSAHPPYHGITYITFRQFFLGLNQTNIQNVEAAFGRFPKPGWITAGQENIEDDANPAAIFYDLLVNARQAIGLADADFNIAGLQAAAALFANEGLGISPLINRSDSAQSLIQQLCEHTDSVVVLDANGLLNLVPIRPPADYSALTQVGDADLADIPKPNAPDWSNCFSSTVIHFYNRDAAWLHDFVSWYDFGTITAALKVANPQELQRDWLTRRDLALEIVQYAGTLGAIPQQGGKLDLLYTDTMWQAMTPGSLFKLSYSLRPNAAGVFRVTKRAVLESGQPVFQIEYTIDRSYLYTI